MFVELNYKFAKLSFGAETRLEFYHDLISFIEDGRGVLEAVEEGAAYYGSDSLGFMFKRWAAEMRNGTKFAAVLDGWVDPAEISFIAAGEKRGEMLEPLRNLVAMLELQVESSRKIRGVLFEPVAYLVLLMLGVIGIALYVVPDFADAMPMDQADSFSAGFFRFCEWLANWGVWIAFGATALFITATLSLPYLTGPLRELLNRLPPYSIYQRVKSSYFLIAVSSMFRSGVGLQEAVFTFFEHASPWMKTHLRAIARRVQEGMNEGDSLQTGLMPKDMAGQVRRYGQRSGFERAFYRSGVKNLKRQQAKLERLAQLAKYASMFGLAGLIGAFLVAVFAAVGPLISGGVG